MAKSPEARGRGSDIAKAHGEKLLEIISVPEESVRDIGRSVVNITERALATTVTPHEQDALKFTASIAYWRLLAQPHSELPPGLVQGHAEGDVKLTYDTRFQLGGACVGHSLEQLEKYGLGRVNYALTDRIAKQSDQIRHTLNEVIQHSQAHAFIRTLATGQLPEHHEDRALTPYWRMVRETQITQEIRSRWGLNPDEPIEPHSEAGYALRRELARLDEEKRRVVNESKETPLQRLQSYFQGLIRAGSRAITGFGKSEGGDNVIYTHDIPDGDDPQDWVQEAARRLALQINEAYPYIQVATEEWLYYLMDEIVWLEDGADMKDIYQQALENSSNYLQDILTSVRILEGSDYSWSGNQGSRLHARLIQPRGRLIDLSQLPNDQAYLHRHNTSRQQAEIITLHDRRLGSVERFSMAARGPHAHRLIQLEPPIPLVQLDGQEDLILRLDSRELGNHQPYVPGYQLVGKTGDKFGLIYDKSADPYASADIPISEKQRHALAAEYSQIGLRGLAEAVSRPGSLTVQNLVSLLQSYSVYLSPHEAVELSLPKRVTVTSINDFKGLVRDERLYTQCSGAGKLLQHSLDSLFGKGSAQTIDGYKLARYTISTGAGHDQTVFTHQGRMYILDATPASRQGRQAADYLFSSYSQRTQAKASAPSTRGKYIHIPKTKGSQNKTEEDATALRREKLQNIRQSLDGQLMALLQVPDTEMLYTRLNKLPQNDPFRIALEVVLRATIYGNIDRSNIEQLQSYLDNYQAADPELHRNMGVRSYKSHAIQVLQNAIEQLLDCY